MFRYIALTWSPASMEQQHRVLALSGRLVGWTEVYRHPGLLIFCSGARAGGVKASRLGADGGVVLGTVFHRTDPESAEMTPPVQEVSDRACGEITSSRGSSLVRNFWGNYVAFLVDHARGQTHIIKDPCGSLPCMRTELAGIQVFFSSIEDVNTLFRARFTIDTKFLRDYVIGGWLIAEGSPFPELDELCRGEAISISHQSNGIVGRELLWQPEFFTKPENALEDVPRAVQLLRATVRHCVRSLGAAHTKILMRLSGGLDSSIVLGCLTHPTAVTDVTLITYFSTNPGANERGWARKAAARFKAPHIEVPLDGARIRLQPMLSAAPMPFPFWLLSYYLKAPVEHHTFEEQAISAVFTGHGGDAIFGSSAIGAALDEYILRHGFGKQALRLAGHIAAFRDITAIAVIKASMRRLLRGYSLQDQARYLATLSRMAPESARGSIITRSYFPHPWFKSVKGSPWGLIYRLGSLVSGPEFYDPYLRQDATGAEVIHPLFSQPVVELCLSIPLYLHFHGGRERALARMAFSDEVPHDIVRRQWKDRGSTLESELVHSNRRFIYDFLSKGTLAGAGLIDGESLKLTLADTPDRKQAEPAALLHCMNVELWARKWMTVH
jgi:asparagine synthase (glutamine-hydrolysing)